MSKKTTSKIIEDNKDLLDQFAMIALKTYLERSPLKGFKDSMSLARISYKQALAMLEIRENALEQLMEEEQIFQRQKRKKDDLELEG